MSKNKPYNEEKDEFGVIRRTFYETTDSDEFVWHRDHEDRVVIPLAENDWMVQFDNELPIKLNVNEEYFIPKNTFHRVIKGSGDLMVEIIETTFEPDEYEILGEGKKKSGGKKDACYYKVKSRYKVWPSAYGSGSLVQCRKVGAKNWGNKTKEEVTENKQKFQDIALDKINKVGGFDKLPDIDKLALLGGTNDGRLMSLDLNKIFKENGGTFGKLEITVRVKDENQQPIKHKFSKEFAGKKGYLYPYINYSEKGEPYVTVRFDDFISDPDYKGGGIYEERPIFLANMYPIDYDEIKSEFVKYQNKVDQDRSDFLSQFGLDNMDDEFDLNESELEVYEGIKSRLKTLNEISSNDAYSKFYANLFDRENPDNDRLIYNKIIQLDPTFKPQNDKLGMYTKWLFRKDNIESLKNTKDEDLYKIKSDLEFFHNAKTKNLLPPESKDINKFNIKTLLDLVFDMQKSGEDLMSKTEKEKEIKSEVDKYELDDWTIIVPKTEEASCYYGKGTRWCTAADNNNMFDRYSYDGPLYILISKHDKSDKYQFHFESSQFMDAKDNPISLSEFMNDNSDVYEFFNGRVGGDLDFEIAKSSLENYDEYGFQDFYSDDFTDKQKKELLRLAFDQDEQSDSFYNVSNVLNYVDYPNMKSDFRDSFIWGLEVSLGNSYDEENYDARMFIDYLGGFNSENISTIVKAANLKDVDQINKLFEIASEYNGEKLLSDYLENEDVNINFDMIKTIGDIKDKFNYSDWRKTVESDLVKIRFNSFDLENGTINITIVPKDENKEPISDKAESGNIKYQNLIKYLTNRQLFNEAKKNRKLTAKPSSEKNLGDWFARKGGKGESKGWVDCNTCRKDKKTGRKKCKPCGRKEGEKRSKYPACRPTPSACKTKGKGKRWGKKSSKANENLVHLIKNMLNENSEMLDVVEVFTIYNSDVHTIEPDVKPVEVPTEPVEKPKKPKTDSPYAPSIRPKTKPKAIK